MPNRMTFLLMELRGSSSNDTSHPGCIQSVKSWQSREQIMNKVFNNVSYEVFYDSCTVHVMTFLLWNNDILHKMNHRKKFRVAWYWNLRFLFPSTYRSTTHGVSREQCSFLKMYQVLFSTRHIKWSSCNSNCWGRPSGWNHFSVPFSFTLHVL